MRSNSTSIGYFHLLQNHVSSKAPLAHFVFDVRILNGYDVMVEALE